MLKKTFLIRRLPLQRTNRNDRWLSCVPNNVHVDLTQQFPYVALKSVTVPPDFQYQNEKQWATNEKLLFQDIFHLEKLPVG